MSKTTRITVEEWQAELDRLARGADPEGMSSREIAEKLGICGAVAGKLIRIGIETGRLQFVGRRMATRIDGVRVQITPVYRFITNEETK